MWAIEFDPSYLVFLGPALLMSAWASWRVHRASAQARRIGAASGSSGARVATAILARCVRAKVRVAEGGGGVLSDHYDPAQKVLHLSPGVYQGRSLAALGIAAHEAGHALQDTTGHPFVKLRNGLVPLAIWGGGLSWLLILMGLPLDNLNLVRAGISAYSLTVMTQLLLLPVELDASRRAHAVLRSLVLIAREEEPVVKRVLSAAALTYVAAPLTSIGTLALYLYRASVAGAHNQ